MLRENLEEEAIIMKDVPDWKVGLQQGGWGSRPLQKCSLPQKTWGRGVVGAKCRKGKAVLGVGTVATRPGGVPAGCLGLRG